MRPLIRVLAVLARATVLLLPLLALGWLLLGGLVSDRARAAVETALSDELELPVRIERLELGLAPPSVEVHGFAIGENGAALSVEHAYARLRLAESLAGGCFAGDAEVRGVRVDPEAFAPPHATARKSAEGHGRSQPSVIPTFHAKSLRVHDATVRIPYPDEPLMLRVARLDGHLGVDPADHRFFYGVEASAIELSRGGAVTRIDTLRGEGREHEDGFALDRAEFHGPQVRLAGQRDEAAGRLRHTARMELTAEALNILTVEMRRFAGRAQVDGVLTGSLLNPVVEAEVVMLPVSFAGHDFGKVTARVRRHGARIAVDSLAAETPDGVLTGKGEMTVDGAVPYAVEASCEAGALQTLLREVGLPELALAGEASVKMHGTLDPPTAELTASGTVAGVDGRQEIAVQAFGSARERGGARLEAWFVNGVENSAGLTLQLATDDTLAGSLRLGIDDPVALRSFFGLERGPAATGSARGVLTLSGSTSIPRLAAALRAENVFSLGVLVRKLQASLELEGGRLAMHRVEGLVGEGAIAASGTLALSASAESAWQAEIREVDTDTLVSLTRELTGTTLPLWKGSLSGKATMRGRWTAPQMEIDAALDAFWLGTEPMERLSLRASSSAWPAWQAEVRLAHDRTESITLTASGRGLDAAATFEARLDSTPWDLSRLRGASLRGRGGHGELHARLTGSPGSFGGTVEVGLADVLWDHRRFGDVSFLASGDRSAWQVRAGLLDGQVGAHGRLRSAGNWPLEIDVGWNDASVGGLFGAGDEVEVVSRGSARLALPLADPFDVNGEARVERFDVRRGAESFKLTSPARIVVRDGRFDLGAVPLEGTKTRLDADGWFSLAGDVHLGVRGAADLILAELLVKEVESAEGAIELEARLDRDPGAAPRLTGTVRLTHGSLDVGAPVEFDDVRAELLLRDTLVVVKELAGQVGGGAFSIDGQIDLERGPALRWTAREITTGAMEWLEHEVSGEGRIEGNWQEIRVSGDVTVRHALYGEKIGVTDFIPWFRRKVKRPPRGHRLSPAVRLDLRVRAPGELFVDNNVAKVELRADMHVSGLAPDVTVSGSLDVVGGQVIFRDRPFDITNGSLVFKPEQGLDNPSLDINAETAVPTPDGVYNVTVQVFGTFERFQVLFGADDPTLTQEDMISLVTLGKTRAQLQQGGAGFSAGDLAAIGAGAYKDDLQRSLRAFLPVDRIEVEPAYFKTTGAFEPRISVGKDITENLSALVSSTFGVESQRAVQVEYRLTPRISLLGTWESETSAQEGAFGGEVKFRRDFRRPRFSLWEER